MSQDVLAAGYKKEFLLSTGLSKERESDGSLYDRFRDRVIFPVHTVSGRVTAFGGRTMRSDKNVAKYVNYDELHYEDENGNIDDYSEAYGEVWTFSSDEMRAFYRLLIS